MGVQSYEELIVWQKSMDLVEHIYRLTEAFPSTEQFGLTAQMRRAAVSIPSNIAEGSKRGSTKDFRHFVTVAFGSGAELETQLKIAKRMKFGSIDAYSEIEQLLEEIMKMLNKLLSKLKA